MSIDDSFSRPRNHELLCEYADKQDNIIYCNKGYDCEHMSKYKIPYAHEGQVGGRQYQCLRGKK